MPRYTGLMADVRIEVRDNGPYRITGRATILDSKGDPLRGDEPVALCRCGQSPVKPLCDGTHKRAGFQSAPRP